MWEGVKPCIRLSLNESPELIAQESGAPRHAVRKNQGLNESPELIAQEFNVVAPVEDRAAASMKVLSLLLRNCVFYVST